MGYTKTVDFIKVTMNKKKCLLNYISYYIYYNYKDNIT